MEKEFAAHLVNGDRLSEAARKAFKWQVAPGTPSYERARTISRSARVRDEIERLQAERLKKVEMTPNVKVKELDLTYLVRLAVERLKNIRDDHTVATRHRFKAIEILEKVQDPAQDLNLVYKYLDLIWDGLKAHCPCCHSSFPLWKIPNEKLAAWRKENAGHRPPTEKPKTDLERRMKLLRAGEKRDSPHTSQVTFLNASERHLLGTGPARTGKSVLLGMWAYLAVLIPGAESWILAKIYDDAESELEYLNRYLTTAFYPFEQNMFKFDYDKKSGEAKFTTRWGSVFKVKSSKSKGSITGRELEFCLVAEPAWVDGDLFEEVRARMSSRLGRIIAMGTPKGFGGFVGRLMRMGSRDMRTGKRLKPGSRLIANGCPWAQSIFIYKLKPKDNPAYVTAELDAARMELTASEYASEFEGEMVADTGRKFPHVNDDHLVLFSRNAFDRSVIVVGIDQGERNFAGVTVAWDGDTLRVLDEYFDNSDSTIKANMVKINADTPSRLRALGPNPDSWLLTIFDADPIVNNQLREMEEERRAWRTDVTYRPKGGQDTGATWRDETCTWLDQLACDNRLLFSLKHCDLLHEQMKEALQPQNVDDTPASTRKKKWVINDPIRKDHVVDALLLAAWTIYSHQVVVQELPPERFDAFEEMRRGYEFQRQVQEKRDLTGYANDAAIYQDVFERPMGDSRAIIIGSPGYFSDES